MNRLKLKQITAAVLSILLVFTVMPQHQMKVYAAEILASGNCGAGEGDNVTWTVYSDGLLTISGTGAMEDYENSGYSPWDEYMDDGSLKSVVIENGVTSIGKFAFSDCSSITSAVIPESVTNIGFMAFYANGLTHVNIPSSVTNIGNDAFGACGSLTDITVESGNTSYASIDGVLFDKNLTKIVQYPAGKTDIEYTIPSGVTVIDHSTFAFSKLSSLTIPKSVTAIGDYAFYSSRITEINYKGSASEWAAVSISERANELLTSGQIAVSYEDNKTGGTTSDGFVYSVNSDNTAEITGYTGTEKNIGIPARIDDIRVKSIGESAFSGYDDGYDFENEKIEIVSVTVPDTVTEIKRSAFAGCKKLESVTFGTNSALLSIGEEAFRDCPVLSSISIPDTVTALQYKTFAGCSGLKSINFGEYTDLSYIYSGVFSDSGLESIDIPRRTYITDIADTFDGCADLKSVNAASDSQRYSSVDGVLFNKNGTEIFLYPQGKESTDGYYRIPDNVFTISGGSFRGSSITDIGIPKSVGYIGNSAFELSSVKNVYFGGSGDDWKTVGIGSGNDKLTSAKITYDSLGPNDTKPLSGSCGDNMTWSFDRETGILSISGTGNMTDYEISSDSDISIPWYDYRNDIKQILINDGVESIGGYAFYGSGSMTEAGISGSLKDVGESAFSGCDLLKNVNYSGSRTTWNAIVIESGNENLTSAKINYAISDTVIALQPATKFVPYSVSLEIEGTAAVRSGSLPEGIILDSTGELHGIALADGNYRFTVEVTLNSISNILSYTLTVNENTDSNVEMSNSEGVEITDKVDNMTSTAIKEQVFEIDGSAAAFSDFQDFYLDGIKLKRGDRLEGDVDYIAEEGSTKITIAQKTFQDAGTGTHTIVAEFKSQNTGKYSYAAQNYTVTRRSSPGGGGGSLPDDYTVKFEEYGGSSVADIKVKRGEAAVNLPEPVRGGYIFEGWCTDTAATKLYNGEAINKNTTLYAKWTERTTPLSADEFNDVGKTDWFYDDVDWAYKSELMKGMAAGEFAPYTAVNKGMAVTVLARISLEDMSGYNADDYTEVESGNWYSTEATWARVNNIIDGEFKSAEGSSTATRGELAVMLKKYLDHMKIRYSKTETILMSDESLMTSEEKEAFSILVSAGIFKGRGDGIMDPDGNTSRAELAALLHRAADYAETHKG